VGGRLPTISLALPFSVGATFLHIVSKMNESLRKSIVECFQRRVHSIAFAPVDRFQAAPEMHHPSQICKDAETVIVFGKVVPKGILNSPQYSLRTPEVLVI
jgi:hypothetical protein